MKKKWIKTGIVFLGAGCWFLALLFYGETEKKAGCFNAYYDTTVLTRSALSAFTEQAEQKESGEQADVLPQTTGWSMEEMQSVSSEVREAVTADVWKIAGSMESFFAGQLAGGSYPWEDDVQGCMVSTALAEKLFGTKNVQGNRITIAGMEYYIRGCVKNGSIFAAVRAEEEEGLNGIFLEYGEKSKPASSAQSLLMQMTGKEANGFFEGNLYSALARAIVSLPLWLLFFVYIRNGYRQLNRISGSGIRFWAKMLVAGAICGMTAAGLAWTFRFSGDYLPAMWSDMGFFPRLIAEKREMFRELQRCLLCPGDAGFFSDLKNTILFTGLTVLAEMIFVSSGSPKQTESRKDGRES